MALIRNGSNILSSLSRMYGAVGAVGLRSVYERGGVKKNFDSGEHAVSGVTSKAAIPSGVRHPLAWKMGTKAGSMASANDINISLSPSASGALGLNGVVNIPVSIDFSQAAMGLVSQGVASITFSITTSSPSIVGVLAGAANFTGLGFSLTPVLGALAGMSTEIPVSVTMSPSITAKGFMAANITSEGEAVTPTSVAAGVWNALAASYDTAGTMGEKLNASGSASNPWIEVIESGLTAAEILRLIAAAVQGNATGLESGSPVFKGLDGTTDRITATYSSGTRNVTGRNAA